MDHPISLDQLPRDLCWRLIQYSPESVLDLRRSCRTLNRHVDEYAKQRKTIPLVETVKLQLYNSSRGNHYLTMGLEISLAKTRLFWLRCLFRQPLFLRKNRCTITKQISSSFRDRYISEVWFDIFTWDSAVIESLSELIHGRVEAVEMAGCSDNEQRQHEWVALILEGTRIGRFTWNNGQHTLRDAGLNHLISVVKSHKVDVLALLVADCRPTTLNIGNILIDLAKSIRALHITQVLVDSVRQDSNYLLGVHEGEWAPIFVEMLSKKMDRLCVKNIFYTGYLSRDGADLLAESTHHEPLIPQ